MATDEIIDRLYGLPLEEFTAARNEAVRGLRRDGERDAAERVKALRKPTVAAGAVNRLVRDHRAGVEEFLLAAEALSDAQFSGKGELGAATRREQAALEQLIATGGEEVRQSLLAAAVDDEAARQVLAGRLVHELEPAGFGTLAAHVTPGGKRLEPRKARAKPGPTPEPTAREASPKTTVPEDEHEPRPEPVPGAAAADHATARVGLDDARAALEAAEAEELQARRHWDDTRRELEKARAAVERALGDLDRRRS